MIRAGNNRHGIAKRREFLAAGLTVTATAFSIADPSAQPPGGGGAPVGGAIRILRSKKSRRRLGSLELSALGLGA